MVFLSSRFKGDSDELFSQAKVIRFFDSTKSFLYFYFSKLLLINLYISVYFCMNLLTIVTIELYKMGRISDANLLLPTPESSKFSWDETRQSLFIESLLIGLPVLPIFAVEASNGCFAVVDGMQRLTALERFLGNQLILSHLNQLTLLNGFQFKDLPLSRQRRFKTREIRLVALTEKADLTVRQEILKRVWL